MMKRRCQHVALALTLGLLGWSGSRWAAAQQSFDKLKEEDRQTFAKRFESEIWPLLMRDGKKGCVGCHGGKIVSALKFSGDPKKDFNHLLKEGFFLHDDEGSLLARVTDKSKERRMPKDGQPWAAKDIETLRKFSADLDKKQQK